MLLARVAPALTIALTWSVTTQPPAAPDPALDPDDVVVTRVVVESTIVPEIRAVTLGRKPIALLIDRTVKLCDSEERLLHAWTCLSGALAPRGLPRQRTTETSFRIPELRLSSVQLVAPDVVQRAFEGGRQAGPDGGWQQLGRLFPGFKGVAQVSAPAYVDGGAVVYASFSCGSLCGKGWLVRLALNEGRWRVIDKKLQWMS
jgi:hypothetical protein